MNYEPTFCEMLTLVKSKRKEKRIAFNGFISQYVKMDLNKNSEPEKTNVQNIIFGS